MSWTLRFEPPIPLPDGGALETLDQARTYILKQPKAAHDAPAFRTAIQALLLVGENGGPPDFARIGMMQALYPPAERVYDPERMRPAWRRGREPSFGKTKRE
jgi:hypothetical protein